MYTFIKADSRDTNIIAAYAAKDGTINAITKAYAKWAKAEGISTSLVSYKEEALELLAAEFPDGIQIADIIGAVGLIEGQYGVVESTAKDYIKAYLHGRGEVYPVSDPRAMIFEWFKLAGDEADHDEFIAWACDEDGLNRSRSNANEYWKGFELHLHLIG